MNTYEGNSSDIVLRAYAPSFLVAPYLKMISSVGEAASRVDASFVFAETVTRYLTAILAAEATGAGVELPAALLALVQKLEAPSFGTWLHAADALARALEGRPGLVAPDVVGILRQGSRPTPAFEGLAALVKLRNERYHHRRTAATPSQLKAEVVAPMLELLGAVRTLRRYPLLVSKDVQDDRERRRRGVVLRAAGDGVVPLEVNEPWFDVPTREPFLVGATGDALLLAPWVVVDEHFRLALLDRQKSGRLLHQPTVDVAFGPEALTSQRTRRAAAMSPRCAARLSENVVQPPKIPQFRIDRQIGEGGSGTVWLAVPESGTGQPVAVKVLHPALAAIESQRRRLRTEHDLMKAVDHPNVVRVLWHGESGDSGLFTVMEYVEGGDLTKHVPAEGLPVDRAVALMTDVLDGLHAAHEAGIVHRDVKPSNVLVDRSGRARLVDFGIGWAADRDVSTRTFEALGTPRFSAPEQFEGRSVDRRADVFGAGALLEYLVTGSIDREGREKAVPDAVRAIVRRATQREPAHRFATALDMRQALVREADLALGAPARVGDRVGGFVVGFVQGRLGPWWAFQATEGTTGEQVGVLLATDDAGKGPLRDGIPRIVPAQRAAIGYRGLFDTEDGYLFAVVRVNDGPPRLAALLTNQGKIPQGVETAAAIVGTTAAAAAAGAALGLAGAGVLGTFALAAKLAKGKKRR